MPAKAAKAPKMDRRADDVTTSTSPAKSAKGKAAAASTKIATAKVTKPRKKVPAVPTAVGTHDLSEEIRTEAYLIWLSEGQPHGCDEAHWARAETVVRSRFAPLSPAAE